MLRLIAVCAVLAGFALSPVAPAAAQGLPVPQYRSILQKKYKEIIATLKASAAKEKSHAT